MRGQGQGQSYAKDESLRARDQLLGQNFSTLSATQQSLAGLSNKMLDVTKPEPLNMSFAFGGVIPAPRSGYRLVQVFVFSNKVRAAKGQFYCDVPMLDIHAWVAGNSNLYVGGSQESGGVVPFKDGGLAQVDIFSPLMTPTSPLVMSFNMKETDTMHECHFRPA